MSDQHDFDGLYAAELAMLQEQANVAQDSPNDAFESSACEVSVPFPSIQTEFEEVRDLFPSADAIHKNAHHATLFDAADVLRGVIRSTQPELRSTAMTERMLGSEGVARVLSFAVSQTEENENECRYQLVECESDGDEDAHRLFSYPPMRTVTIEAENAEERPVFNSTSCDEVAGSEESTAKQSASLSGKMTLTKRVPREAMLILGSNGVARWATILPEEALANDSDGEHECNNVDEPAMPIEDFCALPAQKFHKIEPISQANVRTKNDAHPGSLWASKYAPNRFSELLSDENVNYTVLAWIKTWEEHVFPQGGHRALVRRKSGKKDDVDQQRIDKRPEHKILLLAGSPGVGKTTLAHVTAKHCGYDVTEINASMQRTMTELQHLIVTAIASGVGASSEADSKETTVFTRIGKPKCLIIDEMDGITSNVVQFLLKQDIHRPVLCLANDAFAPVLRDLRQAIGPGALIQLPPISPQALAHRLMHIIDLEGFGQSGKTRGINLSSSLDRSSVLELAHMSNGDVRCCLNTLQFVCRQLQYKSTTNTTLGSILDGLKGKDATLGLWPCWDAVFHRKDRSKYLTLLQKEFPEIILSHNVQCKPVPRLEAPNLTKDDSFFGTTVNPDDDKRKRSRSGGNRLPKVSPTTVSLRSDVGFHYVHALLDHYCGDAETFIDGAFQHYPTQRYTDYDLTRTSKCASFFAVSDQLGHRSKGFSGGGNMAGASAFAQALPAYAGSRCFLSCSSLVKPRNVSFPKEAANAFRQENQNKAVLRSFVEGIDSFIGQTSASLERIIFPTLALQKPNTCFRSEKNFPPIVGAQPSLRTPPPTPPRPTVRAHKDLHPPPPVVSFQLPPQIPPFVFTQSAVVEDLIPLLPKCLTPSFHLPPTFTAATPLSTIDKLSFHQLAQTCCTYGITFEEQAAQSTEKPSTETANQSQREKKYGQVLMNPDIESIASIPHLTSHDPATTATLGMLQGTSNVSGKFPGGWKSAGSRPTGTSYKMLSTAPDAGGVEQNAKQNERLQLLLSSYNDTSQKFLYTYGVPEKRPSHSFRLRDDVKRVLIDEIHKIKLQRHNLAFLGKAPLNRSLPLPAIKTIDTSSNSQEPISRTNVIPAAPETIALSPTECSFPKEGIKKDFFGRPINAKNLKPKPSKEPTKETKLEPSLETGLIQKENWAKYSHFDGATNEVRRTATISDFL